MQLAYQKLGTDHPLYGQVDYLVADGMQPICYKTKEGYRALENDSDAVQSSTNQAEVVTRGLFVLLFKVNGESEEMTFGSMKKLDKMRAKLEAKEFVTDLSVKEYRVLV